MTHRSRRGRIAAQLADLKMPGALEALDEILSGVDGGGVTAGEAIERLLVLYFYLFRHDFSNSHRPEALWISHFDSLLQKVISPCRGGEGPSPVHLESPQGTVCRPS